MVQPGMVYISHPTEYGSLYTLSEVEAIRAVCNTYGLPLYIDGARLGYALAAKENELTLQDLARLSDAFYIGGTKVGALLGEAIVFPKGMDKLFPTHAKRQGCHARQRDLCRPSSFRSSLRTICMNGWAVTASTWPWN